MAPDVELFIANPHSWGDLKKAVDWMARARSEGNKRIVGVRLRWPRRRHILQQQQPGRTIDEAVDQDITWINAAGNSAGRVWYGRFSDPERRQAPDDVGNTLILTWQATELRCLGRRLGSADCDLDLELYRNARGPDGRYILVGADITEQDGTAGSVPFAGLVFRNEITAAQAGVFFLVIRYECANAPEWVQLLVYETSILQYRSSSHPWATRRKAAALEVGGWGNSLLGHCCHRCVQLQRSDHRWSDQAGHYWSCVRNHDHATYLFP